MSNQALIFAILCLHLACGCLITNCPRGGKRSKLSFGENGIKPCISCGPGQTGQCYGPKICCGPFGCLIGTPETVRCQREGLFHENEPCIAGNASCRKNTGRCAADGICCNQDSCVSDKTCNEKIRFLPETPLDLYNVINYEVASY